MTTPTMPKLPKTPTDKHKAITRSLTAFINEFAPQNAFEAIARYRQALFEVYSDFFGFVLQEKALEASKQEETRLFLWSCLDATLQGSSCNPAQLAEDTVGRMFQLYGQRGDGVPNAKYENIFTVHGQLITKASIDREATLRQLNCLNKLLGCFDYPNG